MTEKTIAHYAVREMIGEGGMGQVYRATDTKLGRDVALKVLPQAFADDDQRMDRFAREAKVLASLNHPNIGAIYGVEEADSSQVLVLELVEGPTLAERIQQGPLGTEEALPIALQIARALEAAHERGVVHRDLKPANVKITPDGTVKVLDFGLAKALESEKPPEELANSPTLTMQATQAGIILGTAAYMSPEQARGMLTDRRTDIWAFGAVLFEMLSGRRAFQGDDVSMILASVLKQDLDWSQLPESTPAPVRAILERCLTADLKNRYQAVGDLRFELERYLDDPQPTTETVGPVVENGPTWRRLLPWALSALLGVALIATLWSSSRPQPQPVKRFDLEIPMSFHLWSGTAASLSPDGTKIAFDAASGIYLNHLDRGETVQIAEVGSNPFFSPDGQWLGFFTPDAVKRMSVTGGSTMTLAPGRSAPSGGVWLDDGTIVYSHADDPLMRIPATGGEPEELTTLGEDEFGHRWPAALPGGKAVLMTRRTRGSFDGTRIEAVSLADGQRKVLVEGGAYHAEYAASGHLLYMLGSTLFAAPFDVENLELTAAPTPVLENVAGSVWNLANGQYSVSEDGSLLVQTGAGDFGRLLAWVDRGGELTPWDREAGPYSWPSLSPDGRRLALEIDDRGEPEIWIEDTSRGTRSRLTFDDADDRNPMWSPDGETIYFVSERNGPRNIYRKRADGTGPVEQITAGDNVREVGSIFRDGLVYVRLGENLDIWTLRFDGDGEPEPFLDSEFRENSPRLSPDGRWLAYVSDESGQEEVYVRPFPKAPGKWQISVDGGQNPVWSPASDELFFYRPNALQGVATGGTVFTVPYEADGGSFQAGNPEELFSGDFAPPFLGNMDVSPDGQRFVMIQQSSTLDSQKLTLVQNWLEELERLVPSGR